MKTVSLNKGAKLNKKKKKQNDKDPNDCELSVNKSAKFNFTEQCEFDVSSKNKKINISNDERTSISNENERTAISNENRKENILDVNKNPKKKKRKSNKSKSNDEKELELSISKKERKKKALDNVDEEEAESVDSGCVEDGSMESLSESLELPTDWTQICSSVVAEHSFVQELLSVVPSRPEFDISQYIEDTPNPKEIEKAKAKKTSDKAAVSEKPSRVSNYEELTKRLEERLHKLKRNRSTKKERIKTKKAQQKLKTKMKILYNKNKKRNKLENSEPDIEGVKKKAAVQSGDGQLVFSKFDFSKPVTTTKQANKGKDLQHLLSKALKEKEKVKKIEASGNLELATEIKDKKAWKGALMRADGQKVKDDIDLLKKSAKRKGQMKKSNKGKWEKRSEKLKEKMAAEEKKRKDNLRARKQDKLKNKMKKMKKKGHIVPGF